MLAEGNSQKAYDILKKYVDEGGSGNRPALKTLKLWEKPSKQTNVEICNTNGLGSNYTAKTHIGKTLI